MRKVSNFAAIRRILKAAALCLVVLIVTGLGGAQGNDLKVWAPIDCGQWVDARNNKISLNFEFYLIGMLNGIVLGAG